MRGFKIHNEYADAINSPLYASTPKAVFAAIAVSHAINGGRCPNAEVLREWFLLHKNGIVPQPPPEHMIEQFNALADIT